MAAGNFVMIDEAKEDFFDGTMDWLNDNHYAVLLTTTHTPSSSADITLTNLTNECADGDYARQDCTGETVNNAAGTVTLDIADISFGSSVTISARYLYILRGTVAGAAGTDLVVGYVDLNTGGGNLSSTNGTFNITINGSGVWTVT